MGQNPEFLKNWHPITLLNTDYKILSKVYATRMKTVLPKLIHADQTGFMKNRDISENTRRLFDIMEYTMLKQLPEVVVAMDFEKAFDRVEYSALFRIMRGYNFGPKFINSIKMLFTDFRIVTINNGHSSPPFSPS